MSYVQIIGWNEFIVPPSLQIFSEGCYFIFNCGENSQRFRLSNKLGLGKIRYIFLTNLSVSSFNGLPSLILSLDGCNTEHVTVFGPPPIRSLLTNLLNTFLELKIKVTIIEVDNDNELCKLLKCNSLTIFGFLHQYNDLNNKFIIEPIHKTFVGYLIKFDTTPGTFNPNSPQLLNVMKSDYGKLKSGIDLILEDGTIVKSCEVCDPPIDGNELLILTHPINLPEFITNSTLYTFYLITNSIHNSNTILTNTIHTNSTVNSSKSNSSSSKSNSSSSKSNSSSSKSNSSSSRSNSRNMSTNSSMSRSISSDNMSNKLIYCNCNLDESFIPSIPYFQRNSLHYQLFPSIFPNLKEKFNGLRIDDVGPLTKFIVHPPKQVKIDTSEILPTNFQDPLDGIGGVDGLGGIDPVELDSVEFDELDGIDSVEWDEYPKLLFLGTGCSVPSVYRNVSSILLQLHKNYSILMDCGEGTLLQIYYISNSFTDFINKLLSIRIIFISHNHADHHLGLYHLISLHNKYNSNYWKPIIISTQHIQYWLKEYENISKLKYESIIITEETHIYYTIYNKPLNLILFPVEHIIDSYGIKIIYEELGSLVYSGDTRPCDNLIKWAKNTNILIHEATFTDEYIQNAIKTLHTTISEAINIGMKCNVENLILTHFSQRFQMIENVNELEFNLIIAMDLMKIPIKSLQKLKKPLQTFNQKLYNILNK